MLNSKIWIISGIIITLILGIILGTILDYKIIFCHRFKHKGWESQEIAQERLLARLSRKLDLTRPQIQAIGGILRVQAVKIKEAKDEFRIKLNAIREETLEKIKPHLTPNQQERYEKLVGLHRKRWEKLCATK